MVISLRCLAQTSTEDFNFSDFKNPPPAVHVHTWWHWMDGRITKDGITKDIESMKQQGIVQATILNVGMSAGKDVQVEQIKFNTEQWYAMFRWALKEAGRLGITIGVHNCDGWSESGGPWITPENSMKKFVFTKTTLNKSRPEIKLPQPVCETSFYRDVAVIAFKNNLLGQFNAFQEQPEVTVNDTINGKSLGDGDPQSMLEVRQNDRIKLSYATETVKSKITVLHNFKGAFYFPGPKKIRYTLKASGDGINYRKVADFETNKFYTTELIPIPETKAKYFTIEVSEIFNLRPWHHAALAELELLGSNEHPVYRPTVPYLLEKTASARILDPEVLNTTNTGIDPKSIIPESSVIDLTDKMEPDGTIDWNIPDGNWSVIRFGYTTTGAENGPATAEGKGLECDKMDTAAVNLHFRNFPQKLIEHAGKFKGNTFKFLMIDSWERGYQTWTKSMPEEFKNRRGYNLISLIPVLCGETIESAAFSEGFLYDFRKTIAELLEQNYYQHFSELCHQNKLELHGEVIYGDIGPFPPIDVLRTNGFLDMPMYEFWAEQNKQSLVEYKPSGSLITNFPAIASNFYNKPVVGAEAYTGFAHYSESPADLKLFGDQAYCSGINQMILHSYVHQPIDKMPGLTLGQHGSHFNRNNPAWRYAKGWIEYQSRIQYMLQKGKTSADVLYYLGDQLPQFLGNKTIGELPKEYRAVPCNFDVLEKLIVNKGNLVFSKEQRYPILVLPDQEAMEFSSLQVIEKLIRNGAFVYGKKPQHMLSLSGLKDRQKFLKLAEKVWHGFNEAGSIRNRYGKGVVVWGEPIANLLSQLKMIPDFTTNLPDSLNLMYIHKITSHSDVFFVVNQQDSLLSRECRFRVTGKIPEIWNPLTGEIKKPVVYSTENGQVHIPVTFQPKESLFFIFREGKMSDNNAIPGNKVEKDTSNLISPEVTEIKNFKGSIIFHPINSEKVDSIPISEFISFTEFPNPNIKYFAGTACYQIDFELDPLYLSNCKSVFLKFPGLDGTAEVRLNNRDLGNIWMSNTMISLPKILKEKNHLEITVATTCRNRIIGDLIEYGALKNIFTSAPVGSFLTKESPLKPSGITGPLQLINYR
jgi:hypothetical protein